MGQPTESQLDAMLPPEDWWDNDTDCRVWTADSVRAYGRTVWQAAMQHAAQICVNHRVSYARQRKSVSGWDGTLSVDCFAEAADACATAIIDDMSKPTAALGSALGASPQPTDQFTMPMICKCFDEAVEKRCPNKAKCAKAVAYGARTGD